MRDQADDKITMILKQADTFLTTCDSTVAKLIQQEMIMKFKINFDVPLNALLRASLNGKESTKIG